MKVKIRFIEGRLGGLGVLEVTSPIDLPLASRVAQVVGTLGLRVAHTERHEGDQRLVQRWVLTERDGSPVGTSRRSQIQALLLEEVGSMRPPSPSSPDLTNALRAS